MIRLRAPLLAGLAAGLFLPGCRTAGFGPGDVARPGQGTRKAFSATMPEARDAARRAFGSITEDYTISEEGDSVRAAHRSVKIAFTFFLSPAPDPGQVVVEAVCQMSMVGADARRKCEGSWLKGVGNILELTAAKKGQPAAAAAAAAPSAAAAPPRQPVSDVDSPSRRGAPRPDDFALVIGIDDYQSLPKADYGVRDAAAARAHFEALGIPARNIISLQGAQATSSKLRSYLQQWLPRNVKPESAVFVYYSGHGAPDPVGGEAYLVPWDADPMFLTTTAYPLKQFYAELAALKAKRVVVALDACFSGSGGRSVLAKGARPLVAKVDESVPPSGNLTVLAAASGSEITGTLEEQGHGMFTYHLLKALGAAAGEPTPRALFEYLKPRVQDDARRQNREQSPTLTGSGADAPL